jgi:hypothetical protein
MKALVCFLCLAVLCATSDAQTFRKHSKRLQVGPNPTAIVAADLDGDGLPEIITADRGRLENPREARPAQDQLSYLVAKGNLKYEAQPQLRTGFAPYCLAVANVDELRAPDILVGNFLAARHRDVTLFRNIGDRLFESHHFSVDDERLVYTQRLDGDSLPVFTTPGITALAVRDINRDGYRDVIAAGWSSDVIIYMPGAIEGYFGRPELTEAKGGPRAIAVADFDGDGQDDLALAMSSGQVALWKGDGEGGFEPVTRFSSRGRLPHQIRAADMNGDGEQDLVVSHWAADDSIVIFYGAGDFRFDSSRELLLGDDREKVEAEIRDIVVGDLDGDGRPDIAAACYRSNEVVVLMNRSEDARLPQSFKKERYAYKKGKPRALCIADFNEDGKPDLGVALWDTNSVALLLGR